jgi:hypothetical protein
VVAVVIAMVFVEVEVLAAIVLLGTLKLVEVERQARRGLLQLLLVTL